MEILVDDLTIYPNFGQRNQTFSRSSFEKPFEKSASGEISFPLLDSIQLESLFVYQETENGERTIIPHRVISAREAFDPKEQSPILVKKDGNEYEGILINKGKNTVTILQSEASDSSRESILLQVRDYDFLERRSDRSVNPSQRHLVLQVPNSNPVTLNYLFNGISWSGQYTIIIDQKMPLKISVLRFSGLINNSTQETINSTKTTLISGNLKTPYQSPAMRPMYAAMKAASEETTQPEVGLDEYLVYPLGEMEIEDQNSVDLLLLTEIPVEKIYLNQVGQEDVSFGYNFKAPQDLPRGSAHIYSASPNHLVGPLIGLSTIPEKREDEKVELVLGQTTRVHVKSNISERSLKVVDNHPTEREIIVQSKLINRTEEIVTIVLQQYIGNDKILSLNSEGKNVASDKFERERGLLKFKVQLNPKSEKDFAYTLVLQSV
jgi:hypothetical protein